VALRNGFGCKKKVVRHKSSPKVQQVALLGLLGFSERFRRFAKIGRAQWRSLKKASVRVALQVVL
jgi:hypothetical protein